MSMSLTEIEKMLMALKVKVDVQNATWDYVSLRIHVNEEMGSDIEGMNIKGAEGWEVVAIIPNAYPDPGKSYEVIFKRRK